jgi:hypothetical protein
VARKDDVGRPPREQLGAADPSGHCPGAVDGVPCRQLRPREVGCHPNQALQTAQIDTETQGFWY